MAIRNFKRRILSGVLAMSLTAGMLTTGNMFVSAEAVQTSDVKVKGFNNQDNGGTGALDLTLNARYNVGISDADGGCLEIVQHNIVNGYTYAVDGVEGKIIAINVSGVTASNQVTQLNGTKIDVKTIVEAKKSGFVYGDITSVAISPDGTKLVASVQEAAYNKKGVVLVFTCEANGSLTYNNIVETGVQPDMVTYSADGTKILTADEGEPREGYGAGVDDPKGSVTIIDAGTLEALIIYFDSYDETQARTDLVASGVVLKKDAKPSEDLEPEFIATSGTKAYVALQEANAVAVLDLTSNSYTGIYSLGTVDYSQVKIDLNKSDDDNIPNEYQPQNYTDTLGLRMPDGITTYEVDGTTYLLTANEGDSREWGGDEEDPTYYINETSKKLTSTSGTKTGKKVTYLDSSKCDGLEDDRTYLYGSRSYSIFKVGTNGLTLVYDSQDDFERITAQYLPDFFNCSNDDISQDDRSNKKGPEPEYVTIGQVAGRTYAFIGLERIGGVMVYDITSPAAPAFVNYINSREFTDDIVGDVSPEGLCFVSATDSNKAMLFAACEVSGTLAAYELESNIDDIILLYTNDTHNAYELNINQEGEVNNLGFSNIASYKKMLESQGYQVCLIDAGDAIQGGTIGALSKGSYITEIMNATGYDIAAPGNHEFDFGMDNFLNTIVDKAEFTYLSSNFTSLANGRSVLDAYKIVDYDGVKVAYVGISTPETFTKSTPAYFQDEKGNYIYSFAEGNNGKDLYNNVQASVDAARDAGADYVVAVSHLGVDGSSSPWMSTEVIANTTGIDAFIDGHSHSTIPEQIVQNKEKKDVVLSSTGTKLQNFGQMILDTVSETITSKLVNNYTEKDSETEEKIAEINEKFTELQESVVATSTVDLVVSDPKTGDRIVRSQETNLGDLCADAYRNLMGADIAFVNGGGVRDNIQKGDITYGEIIAVHPFGNLACMVEATGQEILDALEFGARFTPDAENGGFLQVSGISYKIDTKVPSSVVTDEKKNFIKVDGAYRVYDVMVGDQALDLNKSYTLASHNYMLKDGGDGFSMFRDNRVLLDEVMVDNEVLINFMKEVFGKVKAGNLYANPYGEGRIKVVLEREVATNTQDGYEIVLQGSERVKQVLLKLSTPEDNKKPAEGNSKPENDGNVSASAPNTGDSSMAVIWLLILMAGILMAAECYKKGKQN